MLDQLKIGDKSSLDDFGASLASRSIQPPPKKVIKETVPFSNVTYDFSKINGELYWEERELEYVFEITADTPEELEEKKIAFSAWVMNVMQENIYDPYEPDWHYVGTYDSLDYDDEDCVEKTTATVVFLAYPYKIANVETVYAFALKTSNIGSTVTNDSAHRVTPVVSAEHSFALVKIADGTTYTFPAGESSDDVFTLEAGANTLRLTAISVAYLAAGTASTASVYGVNIYETCTPNEDGTYTLSNQFTGGNIEDAIGMWFEKGGVLYKITGVVGSADVNCVPCTVTTGVPSSNNIKIRFNREVF